MAQVARMTEAKDADAAYIIGKINEADKLEAEAKVEQQSSEGKTRHSLACRIEAGQRLMEVRDRLAKSGQRACPDFARWSEENGFAQATVSRLMQLAGDTEEVREERKAHPIPFPIFASVSTNHLLSLFNRDRL